MAKKFRLVVRPPNVTATELPPTLRVLCPLLLDLGIANASTKDFTITMNVIFQPVPVRRKKLTKVVDWYLASTGAMLQVLVSEGSISNPTIPATVLVEHKNEQASTVKSELKVKPTVKVKAAGAETQLDPGQVGYAHEEQRSHTANYSDEESPVAVAMIGSNIAKWEIDMPRGEKIFRDFLLCNFRLNVDCTWKGVHKAGTVNLRASSIRFFDENRRVLSWPESLIMWYVLRKRQNGFGNRDRVDLEFTIQNP